MMMGSGSSVGEAETLLLMMLLMMVMMVMMMMGSGSSVGEAETEELGDVLSPAAKLWRRQGPSLWKAAQPT